MEDDAVTSLRGLSVRLAMCRPCYLRGPELPWLRATCGSFASAKGVAAPLAKVALSPLPSFAGPNQSTTVAPPIPAASTAIPPGISPLPLLAQAQNKPTTTATPDPEDPQRFATPSPGQVVDEGRRVRKEEKAQTRRSQKAKPECDSDAVPGQDGLYQAELPERQPALVCDSVLPPQRTDRLPAGAAVYYSFWRPDRTTKVLFPLFADRRTTKKRPATPGSFRRTSTSANRGCGRTASGRFFLSELRRQRRKGQIGWTFAAVLVTRRTDAQTVVLPPLLFWHHHNVEEKRTDTGFCRCCCLSAKIQSCRRRSFGARFLPQDAGSHRRGLPAAGLSLEDGGKAPTMVLPLFYDGENYQTGTRTSTLFPLYLYHRGADKSRLLVTPLGGSYRNPEEESTTTVLLTRRRSIAMIRCGALRRCCRRWRCGIATRRRARPGVIPVRSSLPATKKVAAKVFSSVSALL